MKRQIEHISLDVWQTLIHSNLNFRKKRNQLLVDHFKINKPFVFVEAAATKRQAWCTRANELVGHNINSFEITLMILEDCQVALHKVSQEDLTLFYEKMEDLFLAFPPILIEENLHAMLAKIRDQQITISLLSNTGLIKGKTLKKFFAKIGLAVHFDFELYSDEIGFSKPNKKVFEFVFEKSRALKNLTPQQIVHIGDNEVADFQGANNAGYQACLIDHTNSSLQHYLNSNVFNLQ